MFSCDMPPPLLARVESRYATFRATDPPSSFWSANHVSDHTLKVDIKFGHICIVDASGLNSKAGDWCHDGIEEFQFVFDGDFSAQKNAFVGKKGSPRRL